MASDRDDRWGDDEGRDRWDDDRRRRPANIEAARAKVATPATLMIVSAVLMLLLWLVNVGVIASGYDVQVAMLEWMEGMQPPGKQKDDFKKQVDEARNRDKTAENIQNGVVSVISLGLNVMILLGGLRMKRLRGYTLALLGSICAIIPLNSCCCIGMPVGIWALIVLVNADVKAAFAANSARSARGADLDRDRDDLDRGRDDLDR